MEYAAPIARIVFRYVLGLTAGATSAIMQDPDVILVLTGAAALAVEGFYLLAKRNGWAT